MKYCRYCGKPIDDDSTFCTYCGKSQTIISNESGFYHSLSNLITKLFSFLYDIKRKIKLPRINMLSNLPKFISWSKRIGVFALAIGLMYLIIGCATWGYYVFQEKKWNSQDNLFINSAIKTNTIDTDSVLAFIELEELHYATDLFDVKHTCSINHKDEVAILINKLAEKGDVNSQLLLGRYYKSGSYYSFRTTNKIHFTDPEKSSYWFYLAAKQGNAEAQGELGHNYKYGSGVKQDFIKALYWTEKGADNGDAVAQWRLGNIYAHGLGYYTKYFSDSNCHTWWYNGETFTSAGDSKETVLNNESIKEMLRYGPSEIIVPKDIKKAYYYWKLASDQGLENAKDNLHKIYDIEEPDTIKD